MASGGAAASLSSNRITPKSASDGNGELWLPYQSLMGNSGFPYQFLSLPSCRGKGTQSLQS